MKNFFQKPYFFILFCIILINLLSFLGFLEPTINKILFFILIILISFIAFYRLEYALWFLFVDLFVGSKGHLFSLEVFGFELSIRMILFMTVMLVWIIGVKNKKYQVSFIRSSFFIYYYIFFIFILLGLVLGLLNNNHVSFVFFDFNAWLYLLLIFPFFDILKDAPSQKKIFIILFAALTWLATKTFLVFFIFSHQIKVIMPDIYYWIRLKGLGEITILEPIYRIFLQSQIYSLIGFFIMLSLLIFLKEKKRYFIFLAIPIIPIILSFSRSFWLSFILTFFIFLVFIKLKESFSWLKIIKIFSLVFFIFVLCLSSLWLSLKIMPQPIIDLSDLFNKRFGADEPAAASRIIQLPYLLPAILKNPTIGSGFGTTVSYFSKDPRVFERHLLGLYTTYAFEWGYLDLWLKIGMTGLFAFLVLIWKNFKMGLKKIKTDEKPLIFGLIFGLIALVITHFVSPYLNHPLGIGYLILCSLIFSNAKQKI